MPDLTWEPADHLAPASRIPPSRIRQIAHLADSVPGTLRLFYGEDSLPTPDFLRDAAKRALDSGLTYYTPNPGYPELRLEIARHVERLHGVSVDGLSEVVVTASGMVALALACQATIGPGDSALVLTPLWPNVSAAVQVTGAEAIEVPLRLGPTSFELDMAALEAAIKPNTRALALASPGNPTAWTATEADWETLVAFCERHDLWLLADGVYERIVFDRPVAPTPLTIPRARPRTIICQSFSKTYRMTGWRVGYAIAPAPVAAKMSALQEFMVSHAFGVAQEAARVALADGEPFVAESQSRYARHRAIAVERLKSVPGVTLPDPTGAFYVFPKLAGLTDSFDFCRYLVERHRVGFAPGSAFGAGGEGHIRICFAVDEAILRDALDRFERGWNEYRRSPAAR